MSCLVKSYKFSYSNKMLFSRYKNEARLDSILHRTQPTEFQTFIKNPTLYLSRKLYSWRRAIPIQPTSPITVVCISDTHNTQVNIPSGDVLIHAGDLTNSGTLEELQATLKWLRLLPHPYKVIIGGNHDLILDILATEEENPTDWSGLIYLNNSSVTIRCDSGRELKIYGSPMTPRHGNGTFQYPRMQDIWKGLLPDDIDILVTHGPPKAHLDLGDLGCEFLLAELWRIQPRLHVFGHIHAGYGQEWVQYDGLQRAYEAASIAGGGCFKLGRVLYELITDFLRPVKESRGGLLVNRSFVGGLKHWNRWTPIRVSI